MSRRRLDVALAERGLARSRSHAARLVAEGHVTVNDGPARKPSTTVDDDDRLALTTTDHYVSRGAYKLVAALDGFGVDVAGRTALDAGASTGGFSQVLLERGARKVLALDVGHGQLSPVLAHEPRLVAVEGVNVRDLTPARLADLTVVDTAPDLVVADLSFISLVTVLPALAAVAAPDTDHVLLVKPQFEAGRAGVHDGVVREPQVRAEAVARVTEAAWGLGLGTVGVLASPVVGAHGNREFLVHLRADGCEHPSQWWSRIRTTAGV